MYENNQKYGEHPKTYKKWLLFYVQVPRSRHDAIEIHNNISIPEICTDK